MTWDKIRVYAPVGFKFGIVEDENQEISLICTNGEWPHGLSPAGGINEIQEGSKSYVVLGDQMRKLVYEGKAKKVWEITEDIISQEFTDNITANNAEKKEVIEGKGIINNNISCTLFSALDSYNIETHYCGKWNEREMLCRKVKILPVEVVVRNEAAGSFCKRYGVAEGSRYPEPIVEFFLKDDKLGDPLIDAGVLISMEILSHLNVKELRERAINITSKLTTIFGKANLKLVDLKLEFGKDKHDKIILADEISPDTCRIKLDGNSLDKDIFRKGTGSVIDAYREVERRLINSSINGI